MLDNKTIILLSSYELVCTVILILFKLFRKITQKKKKQIR